MKRSEGGSKAIQPFDITKNHTRANKLETSLLIGISQIYTVSRGQNWKEMLQEVPNPQYIVGNRLEKP